MQGRKVAKTMLNGQIPRLPDTPEPPETSDEQDITKKPKRVTKTKLEINRPTAEQIIAASNAAAAEEGQQSPRKVPKTMMDVARPDLSASEAAVLDAANETPEDKRAVPKTMLEISRPDLSRTDIPTTAKTNEEQPKKAAKTMLEMSLPAASDTARQLKKVSKTMVDVNSLDAIGMAKAIKNERANVPVKVRKTLTREQALPSLADVNAALGAALDSAFDAAAADANNVSTNQDMSTTIKSEDSLKKARKKTRGTERFVAKTLMDHSVLSEQVVRLHEKEKVKAAYIAQERANEPVKESHEVDSKKMASPCAWSWTETGGKKGRVRACERCQTQVYDFSGMEMPEAEALIFKQESKKKFALYKRADGKFMTTDCPVQVQRKRNLVLLCVVGALAMISAVLLMVLMPPAPKPQAPAAVPTRTNEASVPGSSSSSTTTTDASGKMHFEAGRADQQQAPISGLFPTVTAQPQTTTQTSTTPAPVTQYSSTTPPATTTDSNTTTTTGDQDSKYWEK